MVILNSGPVVRLDNGTLEMRGERKTAVGEESEWGKGREVRWSNLKVTMRGDRSGGGPASRSAAHRLPVSKNFSLSEA